MCVFGQAEGEPPEEQAKAQQAYQRCDPHDADAAPVCTVGSGLQAVSFSCTAWWSPDDQELAGIRPRAHRPARCTDTDDARHLTGDSVREHVCQPRV